MGIAAATLLAALPAAAWGKTVLLVVGSTTLGAADAALKNRLNRYYDVTVADDGAPADTTKDLVVISNSAAGTVGAKYKAAPTGVLVMQPQLFDDMALTGSGAVGTATGQTKVKIVDAQHQMAAGESGLVAVYASGQGVGWGTPAGGATKVALTADGNTNHAAIFGYQAGAAMAGGFTAPARRVGYYVTAANALTASGLLLLDYALDYADGNVPPVPGGSTGAITWASTITRLAKGCGDWAPTWAADGDLYTPYGDCNGVSGTLSPKRSMGLARITGSPAAGGVSAADIDTGPAGAPDIDADPGGLDALGDGKNGKKPSGMLFANNALYAWVRNIKTDGTQSRLRYATANYNQPRSSWSWAPWAFTEFGYPVFVQDGQSYASGGTYVYVVAHDGPSAYTPADRFILMRVPVGQILTQTAYEFFSGTPGHPTWASFDQRVQRTAIFTSKGRCYRSGMTYDAARGRYYWWQQIPGADTRFFGGFGVYSASQPWGPWIPVYYTEKWDVGPGEKADLPSKWMDGNAISSAGGVYLLFSGNDTLSIRKGTIAAGF